MATEPQENAGIASAFPRGKISVAGLLSAGAAFAAAGTVLAFLGNFWWVFDLFCHWRFQYLVCLGSVAMCLLPLRRRKEALCYAVFALVNAIDILPFYLAADPPNEPRGPVLRVALSNVNTYHGDSDRTLKILDGLDADIVVLLEIDERWLDAVAPLRETHPHFLEIPRRDNFGIGIYSALPLARVDTLYLGTPSEEFHAPRNVFVDSAVPTLVAEIDTPQGQFTLIATHPVPPLSARHAAARNRHLEALGAFMRTVSHPLVLVGDLNTTPWSPVFSKLLDASGLVDSAVGNGIQPTWPAVNPFMRIPLDHCLHSPDVLILHRTVGPATGSDHFPLTVDFAVPGGPADPEEFGSGGTPGPNSRPGRVGLNTADEVY